LKSPAIEAGGEVVAGDTGNRVANGLCELVVLLLPLVPKLLERLARCDEQRVDDNGCIRVEQSS
jgi:hypothetical protein